MTQDLFRFPRVETPPEDFDIQAYFAERHILDQFVMVEYGHGPWPVVYQQGFNFDSNKQNKNRAYIGVEGWLRAEEPEIGHEVLAEARQSNEHHTNVFYMSHNLGGTVKGRNADDPHASWYEGEYRTATNLPDGIADEVVLSNVIGDPLTAVKYEPLMNLLSEVARVMSDSGVAVIRETLTPELTILVSDEILHRAGLQVKAIYRYGEAEWSALEAKYQVDKTTKISENAYYLILAKEDQVDSIGLAA